MKGTFGYYHDDEDISSAELESLKVSIYFVFIGQYYIR